MKSPTMRYTFPTTYLAEAALRQAEFSAGARPATVEADGPLGVSVTTKSANDLLFWHSLLSAGHGTRLA